MPTEDVQKQQNDQDENTESEKELSEEELDQASGGSLNFTAPTSPSVSPSLNFTEKWTPTQRG
ncbi:MAG TPA: hypothetical protein VKQ72_07000 [Aggregatilineales bacterium]|nr:hypothetical protein [Aggregatilineales bacterium]